MMISIVPQVSMEARIPLRNLRNDLASEFVPQRGRQSTSNAAGALKTNLPYFIMSIMDRLSPDNGILL